MGQQRTVWDETYSERVLAALSMVLLLQPSRWQASDAPYPQAIFRARYREFCDLPLTFNATKTLSVGHTSRIGLLSAENAASLSPLSLDQIDQAVALSPPVLQKCLKPAPLDRREARLVEVLQVINAAFLALSPGALVANFVSAAEILVDSQAASGQPSDRGWTRRAERIKVLAGVAAAETVEKLINARHEFVHAAGQPPSDRYPYAALALAVQAWAVMAELSTRLRNTQDAEALLDACADAKRISGPNSGLAANLQSSVPVGPVGAVDWIRHHLSQHSL